MTSAECAALNSYLKCHLVECLTVLSFHWPVEVCIYFFRSPGVPARFRHCIYSLSGMAVAMCLYYCVIAFYYSYTVFLLIYLQRRDVYGAWEQYLGLEHSDSAPKRAYTANQVRCSFRVLAKHVGWYEKKLFVCVLRHRNYSLSGTFLFILLRIFFPHLDWGAILSICFL